MTNVTILTAEQIETRWPSNDDCFITYLVKTAIKRNYQIALIEGKIFVCPDTNFRTFCILSLEGTYPHASFQYIVDPTEILEGKIYIAFS